MKRVFKKKQKITRGMPSAVLLSIAIHAALFFLAGALVVFTVVKKKEIEFEPPKAVERPRMKLKKPKVKIKKTSKPKPTNRIVTKVNRASMPDIQLPEMSGMGEGLSGGIGGFDMMPDFDDVTVFGGGQSIGNDFIGTFYDFKRDRQGRDRAMDTGTFQQKVAKFVRGGWKTSDLARYYRSPKTLYATSFMMPPIPSLLAPAAFGEADTAAYCWLVHYKGQFVHPTGGRFRFRGRADDILLVRVDGKVVLNGSIPDNGIMFIYSNWQNSTSESQKHCMGNSYRGNRKAEVGNWITLEPGVPLEMEVIMGEVPGGEFSAMLVVEEEGAEYERNRQGGPILPMFTTAEPTLDLIDEILKHLVPGEAGIANLPVFCDYKTGGDASTARVGKTTPPETTSEEGHSDETGMRVWTGLGGGTLEARYLAMVGGKVVLETAKGKQQKIPVTELSPEDRNHVELINPPEFNIDFSKQTSQRIPDPGPYNQDAVIRVIDYVFGAKLKQTSSGAYNHELRVEFFAIGAENGGDKYILLDRKESTFTPAKENERSHSFRGKPIELLDYITDSQRRGEKYSGFLITVTDERGKIIGSRTSDDWLFENLGNLKKLPVGRYMDKTCTRAHPTSPKANYPQ
ncbi:MAG: hypothetical protein ABFR33_07790 [Verrucomicrobiota bacterium]